MSSESEHCDGDAGDGRSAGTLCTSRGRDTLVAMMLLLTGLYPSFNSFSFFFRPELCQKMSCYSFIRKFICKIDTVNRVGL